MEPGLYNPTREATFPSIVGQDHRSKVIGWLGVVDLEDLHDDSKEMRRCVRPLVQPIQDHLGIDGVHVSEGVVGEMDASESAELR
jgi:hypothetical protein